MVGGGVLEKIPSVGEVWIFSGITQCIDLIVRWCQGLFSIKLHICKNKISLILLAQFFYNVTC